ncbi:MAG: TIGR03905 family TSCPD domain-containing protein [Oscillospiraceae bacterium]|nr:TIGR03905 family TSCPD domain-containing protein [Oscillospiraceae bacterium]
MKYTYKPRGICASRIELEVEDGVIGTVSLFGGCDGNHKGLTALLRGMKVDEAIERIEGITCNARPTSCPDQVAQALKLIRDGAL